MAMDSFAYYLEKSPQILELYLGWNRIAQKGSELIFKSALMTNLKVLDLSWNNIEGEVTNLWYFFLNQ